MFKNQNQTMQLRETESTFLGIRNFTSSHTDGFKFVSYGTTSILNLLEIILKIFMFNQFIHFRHALPKSINRYKLCRREETLNSSSAAIRNFRFLNGLF